MPKFFWDFGMTDFLLQEISMLKLFYCKSIPIMNFNSIFCCQLRLVIWSSFYIITVNFYSYETRMWILT